LIYSKHVAQCTNFAASIALVLLLGYSQAACAQSSDIQNVASASALDSSALLSNRSAAGVITEDDLIPKITPLFDDLKVGKERRILLDLPRDTTRSRLGGETLMLTIAYEPRPVGGILRLSASMLPLFSGIGNASRPLAKQELAEAVDYIDVDDVANRAAGLLLQLREETVLHAAEMPPHDTGAH
jgi:hypothetical protein